jgi:hypothetical protein
MCHRRRRRDDPAQAADGGDVEDRRRDRPADVRR